MRARLGVLAVGCLMLLVACAPQSATSDDSEDGALTGVDVSNASEAQLAEIDDRSVTADEYHAAFRRYQDCLISAGFELTDVEFTNNIYEFGVPNAAVEDGADESCYDSEFRYTDMLWQSSPAVQDVSDTARTVRSCLQEYGIQPAESLEEMNEQLREADIEIHECLS